MTRLSDAAHPMMQDLAQGACMALGGSAKLLEAVAACDFDMARALLR